jgi:hypothetical protein
LESKINDPKLKRQIEQINWTRLMEQAIHNEQATKDIESLRAAQMESITTALRE